MPDLRVHGLTPTDVRGAPRRSELETWRVPLMVLDLLKGVLTRAGFDIALPIHVHESVEPAGFIFTQ